MKRIVLLAYPGFQILDVAGPASVFGAANRAVPQSYQITVASVAGGAIAANSGVAVQTTALAEIAAESVHTLLIAGGDPEGLAELGVSAAPRSWAVELQARGARLGSVCTGTFVLAAWRIVGARRVTTHWGAADDLARSFPGLAIDSKPLWIEDGDLWTSAGVSTGIDMALAMVGRDLGELAAAAVARRLVLPLRRSGNQAQYSLALEAQSGDAGRYQDLIAYVADHLHCSHSVEELARRAGQSTRSFQRSFERVVGRSPAAFVAALRLERARDLLASGMSVKATAKACGFAAPDRLTRAFTRSYGITPAGFARR